MEKEHTHTNTSKLQNEENDFEQRKLSMEIKQHFYDAHFFPALNTSCLTTIAMVWIFIPCTVSVLVTLFHYIVEIIQLE